MNFSHECYSLSQAASEETRLLASVRPTSSLGRVEVPVAVGFAAIFIGVLGIFLGKSVVVALAIVVGVIAHRQVQYRKHKCQEIRKQFAEADVAQLKLIAEIGNEFPEVAEAVGHWLKDGKVILHRDAVAIFDYAEVAKPAKQKRELLSALRS